MSNQTHLDCHQSGHTPTAVRTPADFHARSRKTGAMTRQATPAKGMRGARIPRLKREWEANQRNRNSTIKRSLTQHGGLVASRLVQKEDDGERECRQNGKGLARREKKNKKTGNLTRQIRWRRNGEEKREKREVRGVSVSETYPNRSQTDTHHSTPSHNIPLIPLLTSQGPPFVAAAVIHRTSTPAAHRDLFPSVPLLVRRYGVEVFRFAGSLFVCCHTGGITQPPAPASTPAFSSLAPHAERRRSACVNCLEQSLPRTVGRPTSDQTR